MTNVARRNGSSLDAINFLLADVRGALGPYINVFLITSEHFSQEAVGTIMTVGGLLGLIVQTPIGYVIDHTHRKRGLLLLGLVVLTLGAVVIYCVPRFWPVMVANMLISTMGDIFPPAISALTLGLFQRKVLAHRLGRNAAWDHAGNVTVAIVAAAIGYMFSQREVFLIVPFSMVLAAFAVLSVPAKAIDHQRARGCDRDEDEAHDSASETLRALLRNRALVVFGLCALLFQFANAPLLPLVGQKLALSHPALATPLTSACIVVAQLVMLPVALAVGRYADRLGRKPLLVLGFTALPLRAVLYTLSDDAVWLVALQVLDGIGAGIFGALLPLVIADATKGTGRYNMAQGAVATAQGIGASLSGIASGFVVQHGGYSAGFLSLGGTAAVALGLLAIAMPETRRLTRVRSGERIGAAQAAE